MATLVEVVYNRIGRRRVVKLYSPESNNGVQILCSDSWFVRKSLEARMISIQTPDDIGVHNRYSPLTVTPNMKKEMECACKTDLFDYKGDEPENHLNSPKLAYQTTYEINLPKGALESLLANADEFERNSQLIQSFSYMTNILPDLEQNLMQYFGIEKARISLSMFPLKNILADAKPNYERAIARLKEIDAFFQKFQSALPLCASSVKEDSDKGYSIIKELFG